MRLLAFASLLICAQAPTLAETHDFIIVEPGPEHWSITQADADAAKTALLNYLVAPHPELLTDRRLGWGERHRAGVASNIDDYDLQYSGIRTNGEKLDPNGARKIAIQGLCGAIRAQFQSLPASIGRIDMSKTWISVSDGGACIFNAVYDPVTRQIVSFSVNGIA